jgi:[ribosomal protein S5]-alanine N-acetyltransferase
MGPWATSGAEYTSPSLGHQNRSVGPSRRTAESGATSRPGAARRALWHRSAMAPPPPETIPRIADLPLVIETARLVLRPLAVSDVEDLWPYVSDPAFPEGMSWEAHPDPRETAGFIEGTAKALGAGTSVTWAIMHGGRACGCISIDDIRWRVRAWRVDRGEIGYWLAPPLWNQGLVTEAARAVVEFGFRTIGLHKLSVGCRADNVGSRRVIEKLGFRYVGRLEDALWRSGRWHPRLRYELTWTEWDSSDSAARGRDDGTG